jgi:hypothetical protein
MDFLKRLFEVLKKASKLDYTHIFIHGILFSMD